MLFREFFCCCFVFFLELYQVFHYEDQRKISLGLGVKGMILQYTRIFVISEKACPQEKMFQHRPNLLGFCQSLIDLREGKYPNSASLAILPHVRQGKDLEAFVKFTKRLRSNYRKDCRMLPSSPHHNNTSLKAYLLQLISHSTSCLIFKKKDGII